MTTLSLSQPMSAPDAQPAGLPAGLPGIPVRLGAGRVLPAGPRPRTLLAPGTLLLAGVRPGNPVDLDGHLQAWGRQPARSLANLIAAAEMVDLRGAGGAGFPTARKLAAMTEQRVSHVVVNGMEGESASGKDGILLEYVPHLVLDGALAVARAVNAPKVVIRISVDRPDLAHLLRPVVAARQHEGAHVSLSIGPSHFVAGEASAVIRAIAGGPALPAELGRPPRLPGRFGRTSARRPLVFLSNVETFARLAVASRGWASGSALVSISGAVAQPGVVELDPEQTLGAAVVRAGGPVGQPRSIICGGWHGAWTGWDSATAETPLTRDAVAAAGGRWGAGAFVLVPDVGDPLAVLSAVAGELADGTAGQCGPCWRGLPEIAQLLADRSSGQEREDAGFDQRAGQLLEQVRGRGICAHPTAAAAAIQSGLEHLAGTDQTSNRTGVRA